ncbi:MAG: hypothetical protein ABIF18_03315 [archaeon]
MSKIESDALYFVDYRGSRDRGVRHLENVCSAFFNRPLQCSDLNVDSLVVRGYGLFDSYSSFIYGNG